MKIHIKTYRDYFDLTPDDRVMCEYCNKQEAVDVHHIQPRGAGGKNNIENLIALCRDCHTLAHREKITKRALFIKHMSNL